jgi:putative redox protein
MSTLLSVHAVHQGAMRVQAGNGKHDVVMDYPLRPDEQSAGFTPLQMLLASLAACSANSLMIVLKRKLNQPVEGLEVDVQGVRSEQHPTVLTKINLDFAVKGASVSRDAVECAIKISEDQLCPVWNMLKVGTPITATFHLDESPPS